jgi:cytochrome b561
MDASRGRTPAGFGGGRDIHIAPGNHFPGISRHNLGRSSLRDGSRKVRIQGRYTGVAILLHWLLALLVLGQIGFGWYLHQVPRNTPPRAVFTNFHKSTGLAIGLIILFRLYWRLTHRPPELPAAIAPWERAAARANHYGLYACMLIMPLSGYIASNFSRFGVRLFNVVTLPPWGIDDRAVYGVFNGIHVLTSYAFVALISLHVLAAARHILVRDGILRRIWPARSPS